MVCRSLVLIKFKVVMVLRMHCFSKPRLFVDDGQVAPLLISVASSFFDFSTKAFMLPGFGHFASNDHIARFQRDCIVAHPANHHVEFMAFLASAVPESSGKNAHCIS